MIKIISLTEAGLNLYSLHGFSPLWIIIHQCQISILIMIIPYIIYFFLGLAQKLTKAAAETLASHPMANGRGQASAMGTDSTLSVCLPSSWWGRRTSRVRRTISGRLKNPAVFVSRWMLCAFHIHVHVWVHKYGCLCGWVQGALHNKRSDYPHSSSMGYGFRNNRSTY